MDSATIKATRPELEEAFRRWNAHVDGNPEKYDFDRTGEPSEYAGRLGIGSTLFRGCLGHPIRVLETVGSRL